MNQITLKTLSVLLMLIVMSCAKQEVRREEYTDDTTFEEFVALFPAQPSGFEGINDDNGKELGENPEIDPLYVKQFIVGQTFIGKEESKENMDNKFVENQDIIYRVAMNLSLNPAFHSLVISANEEGNPSNEWTYYLLNYTKQGKLIDAILLSYRNSYIDEETTANLQQSEYRYVRFLPEKQLYFVDVSYDNRNTAKIGTNSDFMLTTSGENDARYFRESWYKLHETGKFTKLKFVERDKNEAKP